MSQNSNFFKRSGGVAYDYITNLVAAYKFPDNLLDYTGNHDVVLTGSAVYLSAKVGKGISLGTESFLMSSDNVDFSFVDAFGDVEATISFWIYFNSVGNSVSVMSKRGSTSSMEWQVFLTGSGLLLFDCFSGTTSNYIRLNYPLNPVINTWYHVVCATDGSQVKEALSMAINGVDVTGSATLTEVGSYSGMSNTTSDFGMCGRDYIAPTLTLDGILNAPKIYKGEKFSSEKITDLYSKENTGIDVLI